MVLTQIQPYMFEPGLQKESDIEEEPGARTPLITAVTRPHLSGGGWYSHAAPPCTRRSIQRIFIVRFFVYTGTGKRIKMMF